MKCAYCGATNLIIQSYCVNEEDQIYHDARVCVTCGKPNFIYSTVKRAGHLDEYVTPPALIKTVVENYVPYTPNTAFTVLDPGCNCGWWNEEVKKHYPLAHTTGVELMQIPVECRRPGTDVFMDSTDFTTWTPPLEFDIIIGNPPYSKPNRGVAEKFIQRSWELLADGGWLIFLLRVNFPCASRRIRGWLKTHPLAKVVYVERPSFYGHDAREEDFYGGQKTNMHDYAVYMWHKSDKATQQQIGILAWRD